MKNAVKVGTRARSVIEEFALPGWAWAEMGLFKESRRQNTRAVCSNLTIRGGGREREIAHERPVVIAWALAYNAYSIRHCVCEGLIRGTGGETVGLFVSEPIPSKKALSPVLSGRNAKQ